MSKRGRPPKLTAQDYPMLREVVAARPTPTLGEITAAVRERTGQRLDRVAVRKALGAAGVVRHQPALERDAQPARRRYGYTAAHRRHASEQRYPSCLTDAEWALVADLFDRPDAQGVPPKHSRRLMVESCCYAVRTGCSWRMLPKEFPHWNNVYKTFRRWSAQGKFEQMHDRLRNLWRERANRAAAPTAAVLDAQSARAVPRKADANGFVVLPKRWVVERTHGWNERARRLIMHHDRLLHVSEAWVWLAEARLLLRRLTTSLFYLHPLRA